MGLSTDPEKRQHQLDNLAAGRAIAGERRARGLPRKAREKPEKSREDAGAAGSRVKPGRYHDEPGKEPAKPKRRRQSKPKGDADGERRETEPPGGSKSSAGPSASIENPLGFDHNDAPDWVNGGAAGDEPPPPPASAADLEAGEAEIEPPPPPEWTPDRAAAVLRGLGFVLGNIDPLSTANPDDGYELWRWTEADALEAGAPLARILNRYSPSRRLAAVSDEAELAFAIGPYLRRNLVARAQLSAERKEAEEPGPYEGADLAVPPTPGDPDLFGGGGAEPGS